MKRMPLLLAALLAVPVVSAVAHAGLKDLPGLQSITIYEQTNGPVFVNFARLGPELTSRLASLGPSSYDFATSAPEYYDVYYSDPDGNFDLDGDDLTIECVYNGPASGHNIDAVQLVFTPPSGSLYAVAVKRVVALDNGVAGSASAALHAPNGQWTTLGRTLNPGERLSLTLAYDVPVPTDRGTWGAIKALFRR
ncbi:MAG: hypothetical protein A2V63_01870 [Candidatus Eisenbacteria bacterium RBG_19FT_COMBO_70_11]|nr:MAG: hypothetical protein A2V63_01870 [Candidatus Eisenbacteria bacterium RBG_19FT_COMBO_70_11]